MTSEDPVEEQAPTGCCWDLWLAAQEVFGVGGNFLEPIKVGIDFC